MQMSQGRGGLHYELLLLAVRVSDPVVVLLQMYSWSLRIHTANICSQRNKQI